MSLAMSRAEREAFLADVHVGLLGVAESGRGPLVVPIWYAYENGELRFVTARTSGGFEVREQGRGSSSLSFAYRIVAHPRQAPDNKRLAKIKLPPLPRSRG